eukprot:TRINITY_DN6763_c0_g1_i2.p1 TRINITY_DN6763_c0_g1~~TRINITY_DN6763_c0_g1_i2.p1  ORF type:complete len:155 (-),score=17.92 TRINITY_DN6763_c0_g1_i2:114-578(-)
MKLFHTLVSIFIYSGSIKADKGCGDGWTEFGSHCYRYFGGALSWHAAQARCEAEGSNLVSIHSQEEKQFLATLYSSNDKDVWIGGNDIDIEGSWVWTDGSDWDYSSWVDGEPSNCCGTPNTCCGGENCLEIDIPRKANLNDVPCKNPKTFICKK